MEKEFLQEDVVNQREQNVCSASTKKTQRSMKRADPPEFDAAVAPTASGQSPVAG